MARRVSDILLVGACALLVGCVCVYDPVSEGYSEMRKSSKRGVSFNFTNIEDLPLLSPACSWAYNWGNSQNNNAAFWFDNNDMDYCPMAWNAGYDKATIREYVAAHPKTKYLLAYNEPNLTDQANMTPQKAAESWPELVAFAKEVGLKLVSPAMNYGTLSGYSDPIKWLDEFFVQPGVSLSDVEAIAIHCYMASPTAVKNYVEMFKKYGKPIWMTEFCAWDPVPSNVEKQMDYMCAVLNYFEQEEAVERYAWFMPRTSDAVDKAPYMQLLTHGSPVELTDLGVLFTQFSSFDTKAYLPIAGGVGAHQYVGVSTDNISLRVDSARNPYIYNMQEGMWADYQVYVSEQNSKLTISYATIVNSQACIYVDGTAVDIIDLPKTGSMTIVNTEETSGSIPHGCHTVRVEVLKGGFNFYTMQN